MTTTHDDATGWRDLADQLTAQQIAEMEYCEREGIPPGMTSPQHQLNAARAMARHNIIQALCADIASPVEAAAGEVYDWEERGADKFGRMYAISSRDVGAMQVDVLGVQYNDGHIERHILLSEADDLTAEQARQLGTALIETANELGRLQ